MRYFLFIFIFCCLFSCSDDKPQTAVAPENPESEVMARNKTAPIPAPKNLSESIIGGVWKMTDMEGAPGTEHFLKNALKEFGSCDWAFNPNGDFALQIGQNRAQGKWSINEGTKTLTTELGRSKTLYEIRELSPTTMRLFLHGLNNEMIYVRK